MRPTYPALSISILALAVSASSPAPTFADSRHMTFVGSLAPWPAGQYSNVSVDAARNVAYLGSWDHQGVAVIDTHDPANPVLTDHLSTHITSELLISDSADLDHVGRYLAVSHQRLTGPGGFEGISIYDIGPDQYHPALLRRVEIPGGVHTVQLDPEVESGRPYAYANSAFSYYMYVVNIETGAVLAQFAASEGIGCVPSPSYCTGFNFAHEGFIQRHPRSGRVLDYVSFWDGGLRIVDVTDPANPTEVGSFDYDYFTNGLTSAHYAAPTPSANWVYLEDEIGILDTGGVHVLDTSACDGTSYCLPVIVGNWHIKGHPTQATAFTSLLHSGKFVPSYFAALKRAEAYDAHNLDVRGENELLVANYSMGIRLIDTSDKTAPVEASFYLPNGNLGDACRMDCGFNMRQTWGSYFGTDGRIYASDIERGLYVVDPREARGVAGTVALAAESPAAASMSAMRSGGPAGAISLRTVTSDAGDAKFALTLGRPGKVRLAIYDVQGRLVATPLSGHLAAGPRTVAWQPRSADGRPLSRGLYLVRLESDAGVATAKFVYLGR